MLRENFVTPGNIGVITAGNGVGGLGKTALAIEYAQAFADEYGGGRRQVRCAGKDDLRSALAELATPMGFEFTEEEMKDADLQFQRTLAELKKLACARAPHLSNFLRAGVLENWNLSNSMKRIHSHFAACLFGCIFIISTQPFMRAEPPAISGTDADYQVPPEMIAAGPFKPTDESLKQYQYPDWFRDAKFGIWAHWGPQAVPRHGDWYARKMYVPGRRPDYKDHLARTAIRQRWATRTSSRCGRRRNGTRRS